MTIDEGNELSAPSTHLGSKETGTQVCGMLHTLSHYLAAELGTAVASREVMSTARQKTA